MNRICLKLNSQPMKHFNLHLFSRCFLFLFLSLNICLAGNLAAQENLANQIDSGIKCIVVDPGFGGRETGPEGCKKGVYAKDINLEVAKKLKLTLEKELQVVVIMTRDIDQFVSLEDRTAIANTHNADLFISIHVNASEISSAHGIETYFLNIISAIDSVQVAAQQNGTSKKNIAELESILSGLILKNTINAGNDLAQKVHDSIYGVLSKKYNGILDRRTKQAPFYVLLGAQMPAILVEMGFITNKNECKRLMTQEYQDDLVDGFVNGIREYISENKI